jgi:hypothetical protein
MEAAEELQPDLGLSPQVSQGMWLSFMSGEASKILYIDALPDVQVEADEWANFTVLAPSPTPPPGLVINRSQFDLTILDASQYPSVSIQTGNITADEGGAVVPVTVVRSGAANASVYVYMSMSGTAVAGTDYTYEPSSLHFARGESVKTVNFTLLSDSTVEGIETIIITLTDISGATPGDRTVSQLSIRDTTSIVTPTPAPVITPTPTPPPTPTPTPVPDIPAVPFLGPVGSGEEGTYAYW